MEDLVWTASIILPPSRTSPGSARRLLEVAAREWALPDLDSAELLLTEVVTNAAVHAGTEMTVRLTVQGGRLRAEVSDCSKSVPQLRRPTVQSEGGRGLLLLQQLSHDWGWEESDDSPRCKTVWFELDSAEPAPVQEFDLESVDAI